MGKDSMSVSMGGSVKSVVSHIIAGDTLVAGVVTVSVAGADGFR